MSSPQWWRSCSSALLFTLSLQMFSHSAGPPASPSPFPHALSLIRLSHSTRVGVRRLISPPVCFRLCCCFCVCLFCCKIPWKVIFAWMWCFWYFWEKLGALRLQVEAHWVLRLVSISFEIQQIDLIQWNTTKDKLARQPNRIFITVPPDILIYV